MRVSHRIDPSARSQIAYTLRNLAFRNHPTPVRIYVDELDKLAQTDFNPDEMTLYSIHGWNNGKDSEINTLIKQAVLSNLNWNLFVVDWPAKYSLYSTCKARVPAVGSILARFVAGTGQDLNLVQFSGHSLGAHVAGHAGSILGSEVSRIVGLDPAYPFYDVNDTDSHLDPSDAVFVEVVHTCGGFLGFQTPLGDVDHYPNGGRVQPGCGANLLGICAHARAYEYFAESLRGGRFVATSCASYDDYRGGKCEGNVEVNMAGFSTRKK